MKKFIVLSLVVVAAGLMNAGCTASGSIHGTSNQKVDSTRQVAYLSTTK